MPLKEKEFRVGHGGSLFTRLPAVAIIISHMDLLLRCSIALGLLAGGGFCSFSPVYAGEPPASGDALEIEVTRKGLGKQVVITQGAKEWFMLIDVTPENSVVVRQEKDRDQYLVDESETHDRPMTQAEVDAAIADYVNSVKTRVKKP